MSQKSHALENGVVRGGEGKLNHELDMITIQKRIGYN